MKKATLIFPHQLFEVNAAILPDSEIFLVEEFLFFKQYNFHRQKLKFQRATMKFYESFLLDKGLKVNYIESIEEIADVRNFIPFLINKGFTEIHFCDVADNWLEKRIKKFGDEIKLIEHSSPMFLNSKEELKSYFKNKKHYFQTDFYIQQRKKRQILLDAEFKPIGGKWSFDSDNRLKYPKNKIPPKILFPKENWFQKEAENYVKRHFDNN